MAELVVGALAALVFYAVVNYARKKELSVAWWQWLLTLLATLYAVFVVEVMLSFLSEGSPKAAAVTGAILGFFAVVWIVLLARFVFSKPKATS